MEAQHHCRRFTMNVAPLESPLSSSPLMNGIAEIDNTLSLGLGSPGNGGDAIARFVAPQTAQASAGMQPGESMPEALQSSASQMYDPMSSMLAQLMQMMQMLMSSLGLGGSYGNGYPPGYTGTPPGYGTGFPPGYGTGTPPGYGTGTPPGYGTGCPPGYGTGCPPYGNERYYGSATGASQGDPHLSFNGNTWDNMSSQPNLLQSNSFAGGYQISTQVTPPSKGISYNQSATISMNGGNTTISMNNQGQASIEEYGQNLPISPGQTVQLGNGENVTCSQNGSLTVQAENGNGGQITTTLTQSGQGVNVKVNAQNVDLGGSLVTGGGQAPPYAPPSVPVLRPYAAQQQNPPA